MAAEIKAQVDDQEFVNRLLDRDWTFEHLESLRLHAYYRGEKHAPFLNACDVLEQGMLDEQLDKPTRSRCLFALNERLQKARSNPAYWARHVHIFSGLMDSLDSFLTETEGPVVNEPEDRDDSHEKIVNSEFPEGRYELSYPIETGQKIRGEPIYSTEEYVLRSDDLEELYNIGLMKKLGGVPATLKDSRTDQHIPLSPEDPPRQ